ncbi:hypothetical protein PILCRDRAFT_828496 [Piloderma croceum F 1598]|uniref:Uncharacterized protein n=1 Tax=Piloderma croceum (strain F 1598) TaxID=765440 RepID=A0A0C3BA49_PILCF|nr:hypothetical protein PILCRDRAFT_828496 [Piloderma croceum F 1598]
MSNTQNVCQYTNGPPMNTDISGIGVRISFYLQTIFLTCLSMKSQKLLEITGAFYTLIAMNMAVAVTSLILGLRAEPEISFHDVLVVFYLLLMSWVAVIGSLSFCHLFVDGTAIIKIWSIAQSYVIFAFTLVILIKSQTFGNNPQCNDNAVVVLFRPFSALRVGRTVGWIVAVTVIAVYTGVTATEYWMKCQGQAQLERIIRRIKIRDTEAEPNLPGLEPVETKRPVAENVASGISGHRIEEQTQSLPSFPAPARPIIEIAVKVILWTIAVTNTELLVRWNHFGSSGSSWRLGEVLPLFLVVLPLMNMVNAFKPSPT